MTAISDVETLAQRIEARDSSVVSDLAALPHRCLTDARNRTLFDIAILANHSGAIAHLSSDPDALEFAAPVHEEAKNPIRHTVAMHNIEYPLSSLESMLEQSFGDGIVYGRTPLQTACRAGNAEAIKLLLAAGAKTTVKDVLGLTAPEIAFYSEGEAGLREFLAIYKSTNRALLPVSKRLLRETFAYPDTMQELLRIAKLDASARRLLFSYRCAWLDIDAVKKMLEDGHDPNNGLTAEINPLWEACTSALLWDEKIPGGMEMAFHFTKYMGHPGASSISIDNSQLNEDGSNFEELFSAASRVQKEQTSMVEKMTISPEARREVIEQRIAMLDVLLGAGADPELARKKLNFGTFADLKNMQLGEVSDQLKLQRRTPDEQSKSPKPASSTFWELVGETSLDAEYWPSDSADGKLRLTLHNVYGPIDDLSLSVLLSQASTEAQGDWNELEPVQETVEVDGETLLRASINKPIYGESPWEAKYEIPLEKDTTATTLWIRLDHEDEALRVELDAWVFA